MASTFAQQKNEGMVHGLKNYFQSTERISSSSYYLSRIASFLVDHFIGLCFYVLIGHVIAKNQQMQIQEVLWVYDIPALVSLTGALLLLLIYFWLMEALFSRTLGKMIFHIKVFREGRKRCGFIGSTNRNMLRIFDSFPCFLPGVLSMLISRHHQRLGDKVAHTEVRVSHSITYFLIGTVGLVAILMWVMEKL